METNYITLHHNNNISVVRRVRRPGLDIGSPHTPIDSVVSILLPSVPTYRWWMSYLAYTDLWSFENFSAQIETKKTKLIGFFTITTKSLRLVDQN